MAAAEATPERRSVLQPTPVAWLKVDQPYPPRVGARSVGPGPASAAATISIKGRGPEGGCLRSTGEASTVSQSFGAN
eukprot:4401100-Alexandrium_andersonii.AAC.1